MKYRILCIVFSLALLAAAVPAHAQQIGCAGGLSNPEPVLCVETGGCQNEIYTNHPLGSEYGDIAYYSTAADCCGTVWPFFVSDGFCQIAKLHIDPKKLQTLDQNLRQHGEYLMLADCAGNYHPFVAPTTSPADLTFPKRLAQMARR